MIADFFFLLAQISLGIFGLAAAFHPSVARFTVAARLAIALGAGTVALTIEATLFSILGLRWSIAGLAAPLLLASLLLAARWRRQTASQGQAPPRPRIGILPILLASFGFAYLAVSLASSASTSVDYLLFWGVKAVRYAQAHGIDAAFLRNPYSNHAVYYYPPLVSIVQSWGVLAAGRMPWRLIPPLTLVWPVATAAVLFDLLRRRIAVGAAEITAFWSVAASFSLAYSYSGANAEAPLLFFETIALGSLLTESPQEPASRFLPSLFLCGAVLTKVEGTAASLLLVAGSLARDALLKRPRPLVKASQLLAGPLLGIAAWFGYELSIGMPVGYRLLGEFGRLHPEHAGSIARNMLHFSNAGTLWLTWIVPLLFLAAFARHWKSLLPALTLAAGLLCLLVFDYLHNVADPGIVIGWTMPRISQPALSALILGAGVASFAKAKEREETPATK